MRHMRQCRDMRQYPKSASELVVGQLGGEPQALVAQLVGRAVGPCEKHGHLKCGHFELEFSVLRIEVDLTHSNALFNA